ncbi:class I SAM-dependent methyltransferase [Cetobacterium somerae]|uniref:class I SAM-dependent methyltransferase n=1 Tax=Cetobacterium sp. NK01 TaxID=2993530 RepID=UPI002116D650|nr:class I SAM-dependent methyltransferase [Cetobacterium sp. NK01]MCQ8213369.1 class I SAM-dependent methyltransferase [Cetobacterium sp. NK01]
MSVEFYNNNAEEFFNNTVNADMSATYSLFEENLSDIDGEILDLGCGSGRDAKYFIDKGYKVTALDLSPVLAEKASKYIGQQVIIGDMKDLDYKDRFIGIWACASLLHLTEDEVFETIKRCHKALKKDGVLYASFKYGENNYEKDGRSFTCFTKDKFLNLIEGLDFYYRATFETGDVRPGRGNEKWLNVILKKG